MNPMVRVSPLMMALLLLTACVTINVYFPAAAAEEAADTIIRDVYGAGESEPEAPATEPSSQLELPADQPLLVSLLNWMVSPAQAQANIDVQSPGIQKLKSAMAARHQKLKAHYNSGAVGMTADGFIKVRDLNAVALKDRKKVNQLVGAENRDREALYKEIARANGHPEWEADIQKTFARRWVGNAPKGWWHQDAGGNWKTK